MPISEICILVCDVMKRQRCCWEKSLVFLSNLSFLLYSNDEHKLFIRYFFCASVAEKSIAVFC